MTPAQAEARNRALAKVDARPRRYCHGCLAVPFIDGSRRPFRAAVVQAAIQENC